MPALVRMADGGDKSEDFATLSLATAKMLQQLTAAHDTELLELRHEVAVLRARLGIAEAPSAPSTSHKESPMRNGAETPGQGSASGPVPAQSDLRAHKPDFLIAWKSGKMSNPHGGDTEVPEDLIVKVPSVNQQRLSTAKQEGSLIATDTETPKTTWLMGKLSLESLGTLSLGQDRPVWLRNIYSSVLVEALMCFFILLNLVTLALVTEAAVVNAGENLREGLYISECLLTALFVIEIGGRCYCYGSFYRTFYPNAWERALNLVDALVVAITNVLFVYILAPAGLSFLHDEHNGWVIRLLMIFRVLRFARFFRVADSFDFCKEIVIIMKGLYGSIRSFIWAIVVLLVIDFVFALIGVVAISTQLHRLAEETTDPKESAELEKLLQYLGDLPAFMYSLAEILTIEGLNPYILRPVQKYLGWSWFYFHTYLAIMHLLVLNLVTAMVVETALANAQDEQARLEMEKQQEIDQLNSLFLLMDDNGDGTLSWDEFKHAFSNPTIKSTWQMLDFKPQDAKEIFKMLDQGDGQIPIEDFFDGLRRMKGIAQARDSFKILKSLEEVTLRLQLIEDVCGVEGFNRAGVTRYGSNAATSSTRSGFLNKPRRNDSGIAV